MTRGGFTPAEYAAAVQQIVPYAPYAIAAAVTLAVLVLVAALIYGLRAIKRMHDAMSIPTWYPMPMQPGEAATVSEGEEQVFSRHREKEHQ